MIPRQYTLSPLLLTAAGLEALEAQHAHDLGLGQALAGFEAAALAPGPGLGEVARVAVRGLLQGGLGAGGAALGQVLARLRRVQVVLAAGDLVEGAERGLRAGVAPGAGAQDELVIHGAHSDGVVFLAF